MKQTLQEQTITALVAPAVEARGLRLVCARMVNEGYGPVLQVMAENPETRNLGIEDCAALSREVSALLDVEDVIDGRYRLEVSSPGIDRVLITEDDFRDYTGCEAKIEIDPPQDGQKRFRGFLDGVREGAVLLKTQEKGQVVLPFTTICKAKLVMNDTLLKRARESQS
ncbi:MAG: ribosome maturation factor RimP [Alphaproteobacteria bacterium]|nr:ribosome maturation factor RimP [Alphaproteobacteria bacterium]